MSFADLKFKQTDFIGKDVKSLPDTVEGQAEFLKNRFDYVAEEMIALGRFNQLLDELDTYGMGDSAKLNGEPASYYAKAADVAVHTASFLSQPNMSYEGMIRKCGVIVYVQIRAKYGAGSTNGIENGAQFARLPAGYRPPGTIYVPAFAYDAARTPATPVQIAVGADGGLKATYLNANAAYQMIAGNFWFPTA